MLHTIIEHTEVEQMLQQWPLIGVLYPNMSEEKYKGYLLEMIRHNYSQVAVFDGNLCVGLTGVWFGTKLWSGKYLEIDSFVVHPNHRKKGIGTMLTHYVHQKAMALGCTMIVLDAFTHNFAAHQFYYNQGYQPRGFHFIKMLNEAGVS